ncbi:nose resistant to fluoxetine protein 6-like [Cydia pomonella]|uniref:nose resistant to fluoxetine protein 6-like n=1 Tax=Cydia pomonella TaxID=82600 RepID=UPI002ADD54C9|nr:nose resistant to fluoxetine protein 6-like [Cydia pomonella]
MFKMIVIPILLFFVYRVEGKIFDLNDTEYRKMPPLFTMDEYQDCMLEPGGTYCVVDLELFSDQESDLMKMINGYSEVTNKHYNHTQLHKAVCLTHTCESYIGHRDIKNEDDVSAILENCLNNTIWKEYKLQARVLALKECQREGDKVTYDISDYSVAGVILVLIMLNSLGTFYDVFKKPDTKGNPYIMSFSLLRNWQKLVAPSGVGPEPRLKRFKLFNGLSVKKSGFESTQLLEKSLKAGDDPSKQILYNGSLVVSTFFVMSGFLLAFNFELHAEKHSISWLELPKGMILRWLRLTPAYALILGLVATVMRRLGTGPLWNQVVTVESDACRQYWWAHLLYINNYIYDDNQCMPQTWYLAADTQLFAIGLVFCIVARTQRARKIILGLMMVVSLLTPALHTYFEDLNAIVSQGPEIVKSLYKTDNVFRHVYIAAHTNLASYTLGMGGGLLAYHWLTEGKDFEHFKKYRYLLWLTFPLDTLVILSGALFYGDARAPMALRVLYAALYKPVFQLLVVFFTICMIFKSEKVYRGIVEWRGFTWTGRVSYSAFLVHTLFLRAFAGSFVQPVHLTDYFVVRTHLPRVVPAFCRGSWEPGILLTTNLPLLCGKNERISVNLEEARTFILKLYTR